MGAEDFRRELLSAGLLIDGGVAGIYQRSFRYESIIRGLESYISRSGSIDESRQLHFAPVMPQSTLVTSGYVRSFPDLMGVISSFAGASRDLPPLLARLDAGEDWSQLLSTTA